MGFEELFDNNRNNNGNYREPRYRNEGRNFHDSPLPFDGFGNNQKLQNIIEKIRSNNKLKVLVIIFASMILITITALIIILFPLIMKLLNYINQNGLQGILNEITGFVDKIWKGSAN